MKERVKLNYTTITNLSMKYLMMCNVCTDVGSIKKQVAQSKGRSGWEKLSSSTRFLIG